MRIVVHGQQAFGRMVLERLIDRNEQVVGVLGGPDRADRPIDPLSELALREGIPFAQPQSWATDQAAELMRAFEPDLCVMAYVTEVTPQSVLQIPDLGTIQYHPSLLPDYRGPSSINWPIIQGATETGLTIFWPNQDLDGGPVLLQKRVSIGPDETVGSLYFNHLLPLGVDALVEAIDLIRVGTAPRVDQDHDRATYRGWCGKADAEINWHERAQTVYNLVRGTNPRPGAWTTCNGTELGIFDCHLTSTAGRPGEVTGCSDAGFTVACEDGGILVQRVRPKNHEKVRAADYIRDGAITIGTRLGN